MVTQIGMLRNAIMSNLDVEEQSIDNAIVDYLSKKNIADQTEKMAIIRISSKLEIPKEKVEISIQRLASRNIIRKIYFQGRVAFELTPKGKSTIESLAKAETERITKQLQESIQQERKSKLRLNAINRIKSIAEDWQNCQIPDVELVDEIELKVNALFAEIKEIEAKRPNCCPAPQMYEKEFSAYKIHLEKLAEQNSDLFREVNNYAKIRNLRACVFDDIQKIGRAVEKYTPVEKTSVKIDELKKHIENLKIVQSKLESFSLDQISHFEELKTKLGQNSRILETLNKPTHEFTLVRKEKSPQTAIQYADPECPTILSDRTIGHSLVEKCIKCGLERKSTPLTIG